MNHVSILSRVHGVSKVALSCCALMQILSGCSKQGAQGDPGATASISIIGATCIQDGATITLVLENSASYGGVFATGSISCSSGLDVWETQSEINIPANGTVSAPLSCALCLDTVITPSTVLLCTLEPTPNANGWFNLSSKLVSCLI